MGIESKIVESFPENISESVMLRRARSTDLSGESNRNERNVPPSSGMATYVPEIRVHNPALSCNTSPTTGWASAARRADPNVADPEEMDQAEAAPNGAIGSNLDDEPPFTTLAAWSLRR